jgi:hypothetical protein
MAGMTDPRERLRRTMPGDVVFNGSELREIVEVECAVDYVEARARGRPTATPRTRLRRTR